MKPQKALSRSVFRKFVDDVFKDFLSLSRAECHFVERIIIGVRAELIHNPETVYEITDVIFFAEIESFIDIFVCRTVRMSVNRVYEHVYARFA